MRLRIAGTLFALLTAFAPTAFAYTSPGAPTGHVNDFARVLSSQTQQSLEAELVSFEQSTSNEIAVAIVPNMGGDYVENYAVKLFQEWGIGTKEKDNGVLLLLSIEDRKMRIEVGYGLEGALPDSVAQRILDNEMTPQLKAGDYDSAVTAGVQAIELATKGEYVGSGPSPVVSAIEHAGWNILIIPLLIFQFLAAILARSKSWWAGGVVGFLGGLAIGWIFAFGTIALFSVAGVMAVLGLILDYFVSKGYQGALAGGVTPPWWVGGSGRGSGGGGFGGFGGGSSGGGGASGSW